MNDYNSGMKVDLHHGSAKRKRLGSDDGLLIFQSMIAWLENQAKAKAA